jgi:cellulose synthase/poly-beta-1,6-N-acetylglucosamine synthase-like glycosyltransferase
MATNFYIAGTTVLEAFMSILPCREARQAVSRLAANNFEFPTPDDELPIIDFLIVAYLPNEKDIIMDQALYALNKIIYPEDKIRINILYNTPKPIEPLQTELQALTKEYSHCRVISVPNSTSKADNLNYFFKLDTGSDVIAIYDCDHFPHPYSPRWAAERFCQDQNVKIVQGRCVVYNSNESLLTQLVTVEFDKIYAVSHPGRAVMMGFALFCGSNGYWKADLIKQLKMDESMLTEDIDSALRAFTVGAKCVHELNVVSYEQAPRYASTHGPLLSLAIIFLTFCSKFDAFWKQRLRWAQGWTQASMKHLKLAWNHSPEGAFNSNRSFSQRFGIFSLLFVREWSYYLVTQYTCLVLGFVITKFPRSPKELLDLIFFQYPISMWLFFIRYVTRVKSPISPRMLTITVLSV